jgi:quercetin dioxygenase-like cupin family protein
MATKATAAVVPSLDRELKLVPRARGTRMVVLIGVDDGAPNFLTRKFVLEPGARIPAHRHPNIEHEQVMLSGEMVLGLDEKTVTVTAGQAVFIPAGVTHWYENRSDANVEFLCMVPRTASYDTEWLEDPPEGAYLP